MSSAAQIEHMQSSQQQIALIRRQQREILRVLDALERKVEVLSFRMQRIETGEGK